MPSFSFLAGTLLALLTTLSQDVSQSPEPIELECRVTTEAQSIELQRWRIVLLRATGEPIGRVEVLGRDPARFRGLKPGTYLACVFGEYGRRKCSSLDLRTDGTEEMQKFVRTLRAPSSSFRSSAGNGVSVWHLGVPDEARAAHVKANEAQRLGDRKQALRHLERAVSLYPEYVEAWNDRGALEHILGKYDEAVDSFARAATLDPNYYPAWVNLASTLLMKSRHEEALDSARRALQLRPNEALANSLAGQICFYLRQYDEAKGYFMRVVRLDPAYASGPHRYLAHIAFAENNVKEGLEHLRAHLALHPNSPDATSIERTIRNLSRRLPQDTSSQVPE